MKGTILTDYSKDLILKTDASNVGLGAVLLQERNGELLPIQWASKKLTSTEQRYTISEKETLAVFWGIKKFEYDLRGRRFKLITDHKALENIRIKPNSNNNRINRWIEQIQEYDFTIQYQKPENLVGADALSRINETNGKDNKTKERANLINQGKISKHVIKEGGKEYWISDNGMKREMPNVECRKSLILAAHEELNHRGVEPTYYKIKQKYYWIGLKQSVENVIKKCEVCTRLNRKNRIGHDFVETNKQFEKVAIDLVDLRAENKYILLGIDYFSRFILAEAILDKRASTVINVLQRWFQEWSPEEIVSDNGREFNNEAMREFVVSRRIDHRKVAPESHKSNGRVERAIRTIRDGLLKSNRNSLNEKLAHVVNSYNKTYHKAIKMTPFEAIKGDDDQLVVENSKYGKYATKFNRGTREKYKMGQNVLICKKENLGRDTKDCKGRFNEKGMIVGVFENDFYLVKKEDGKMIKKRYFDIKNDVSYGLNVSETAV